MRPPVVIATVLALGAWATMLMHAPRSEESSQVGGPFHLVESKTSRPFDAAALRGTPAVLFFGFTHCPDVCPTALSRVTRWLEALGSEGDRLRFVFITVDPERDTAERMARYLTAFERRIIGLTGSRAEIDGVVARYKIVAHRRPAEVGDSYTYDHTARLQVFDAQGRFQGTLDFDDPESEVLARLRALIRGDHLPSAGS